MTTTIEAFAYSAETADGLHEACIGINTSEDDKPIVQTYFTIYPLGDHYAFQRDAFAIDLAQKYERWINEAGVIVPHLAAHMIARPSV